MNSKIQQTLKLLRDNKTVRVLTHEELTQQLTNGTFYKTTYYLSNGWTIDDKWGLTWDLEHDLTVAVYNENGELVASGFHVNDICKRYFKQIITRN